MDIRDADFLKTTPTMTFIKPIPTYYKHRTEEECKRAVLSYLSSCGIGREDAEVWFSAYMHTFDIHPLKETWNALDTNGVDYETDDEEPFNEKCLHMDFIEEILSLHSKRMKDVRKDLFEMVEKMGADLHTLKEELCFGIKSCKNGYRTYTSFSVEPIHHSFSPASRVTSVLNS